MFFCIGDAEKALNGIKVSKKDKQFFKDEIEKHLFIYKELKKVPNQFTLLFLNIKDRGFVTVRLFDKNSVPVENLDNSYNILYDVVKKKVDVVSAYSVNFLEDFKSFEVLSYKIRDIGSVDFKKVKSVTYAVSDGEDCASLVINQLDVKGAEYDMLRDAARYFYNKQLEKNVDTVDCIAIEYL